MQQHTYAFAKEGGRVLINVSQSEKPEDISEEVDDSESELGINSIWQTLTRAMERARAEDGVRDKPVEEDKNLALPKFKPIDFDNTGERDAVIKHFIGLAQQIPELTEVVYIAVRNFFSAGKIGYYLAQELSKSDLNIKGEIEAFPLEMDELPGINLNDIYAVSFTVQRPNV